MRRREFITLSVARQHLAARGAGAAARAQCARIGVLTAVAALTIRMQARIAAFLQARTNRAGPRAATWDRYPLGCGPMPSDIRR